MSEVKEPHFFSSEKNFSRGSEWHDSLFAGSLGTIPEPAWYGESSTSYAVWEPALDRIQGCLREPRFIVLLRHPVERLLSHYRWMYALGLERKSLIAAIESELNSEYDFDNGARNGNYPWYVRHSRYAIFANRLVGLFGADSLLFIRSEDLAQHPTIVLRRCWDFLGLETIPDVEQVRLNPTQEKRVQRTLGIDNLVKLFPPTFREAVDPQGRIRQKVKSALGTSQLVAPEPTEQDLLWLEKELVSDIEYFAEIPRIVGQSPLGEPGRKEA